MTFGERKKLCCTEPSTSSNVWLTLHKIVHDPGRLVVGKRCVQKEMGSARYQQAMI